MDIAHYENIKYSADQKIYSFVSNGPKGDLSKLVKFSSFHQIPNCHNLALGTKRGVFIDYEETTDNNDRDKILATIVNIAKIFSAAYPDQKIYIRGRNAATTRLYRAAINHAYKELISEYFIYGVTGIYDDGEFTFEIFERVKEYDAFLFERR